MIMPTLVSVRKNSSSSSIAIKGAGMLPFITPTSMIWRGSTWPVRHWLGALGSAHALDPGPIVTFGADVYPVPVKLTLIVVTTPPEMLEVPRAVRPPGVVGGLKVTEGAPRYPLPPLLTVTSV